MGTPQNPENVFELQIGFKKTWWIVAQLLTV